MGVGNVGMLKGLSLCFVLFFNEFYSEGHSLSVTEELQARKIRLLNMLLERELFMNSLWGEQFVLEAMTLEIENFDWSKSFDI